MEDRFINEIEKIMEANRKIEISSTGQYTLGMLIDKLKQIQESNKDEEPNMGITFSFGNLVPDGLDSYRGYYNELAIGYMDMTHETITVPIFIQELEAAVGKTFYGYKGGEYVMTENTPLWVSKYGDNSGTYICDVKDLRYTAMLVTRNTEE